MTDIATTIHRRVRRGGCRVAIFVLVTNSDGLVVFKCWRVSRECLSSPKYLSCLRLVEASMISIFGCPVRIELIVLAPVCTLCHVMSARYVRSAKYFSEPDF